MKYKGLFEGALGQVLNDELKEKLDAAVKAAVEDYSITDFYFFNEEENEESEILSKAISEKKKIGEYIADKLKEYKELNKEKNITSSMIAARPIDKNYNEELYEEIIQGYLIYGQELDCEESTEAYALRNQFLANNIDIVLWYSNPILESTSEMIQFAKEKDKIIKHL